MRNIDEEIKSIGIVPVVVLNDADDAEPLAKALIDGGIPCAEVTFRTDASEESIRRMRKKYPQMLIGAGTVLTTEQVDKAVNAGAEFIVSPGFNKKVVQYCIEKNIPVYPGVSSPSNIEAAIELGLDTVKFFPAEAKGGIKAIKSMAGPYTGIKFMPTGGINEKNINDYLSFDRIIACGGSWMVKEDLVESKRFKEIETITRNAVLKMLNLKMDCVRINADNENVDEIEKSAKMIAMLLGVDTKSDSGVIYVGDIIKILDKQKIGTHGSIEISTNSVLRSVKYFSRQGIEFDSESKKYDNKGNLVEVALNKELMGFKFYIVKNK